MIPILPMTCSASGQSSTAKLAPSVMALFRDLPKSPQRSLSRLCAHVNRRKTNEAKRPPGAPPGTQPARQARYIGYPGDHRLVRCVGPAGHYLDDGGIAWTTT